jgi:hypothetical protein
LLKSVTHVPPVRELIEALPGFQLPDGSHALSARQLERRCKYMIGRFRSECVQDQYIPLPPQSANTFQKPDLWHCRVCPYEETRSAVKQEFTREIQQEAKQEVKQREGSQRHRDYNPSHCPCRCCINAHAGMDCQSQREDLPGRMCALPSQHQPLRPLDLLRRIAACRQLPRSFDLQCRFRFQCHDTMAAGQPLSRSLGLHRRFRSQRHDAAVAVCRQSSGSPEIYRRHQSHPYLAVVVAHRYSSRKCRSSTRFRQ